MERIPKIPKRLQSYRRKATSISTSMGKILDICIRIAGLNLGKHAFRIRMRCIHSGRQHIPGLCVQVAPVGSQENLYSSKVLRCVIRLFDCIFWTYSAPDPGSFQADTNGTHCLWSRPTDDHRKLCDTQPHRFLHMRQRKHQSHWQDRQPFPRSAGLRFLPQCYF